MYNLDHFVVPRYGTIRVDFATHIIHVGLSVIIRTLSGFNMDFIWYAFVLSVIRPFNTRYRHLFVETGTSM